MNLLLWTPTTKTCLNNRIVVRIHLFPLNHWSHIVLLEIGNRSDTTDFSNSIGPTENYGRSQAGSPVGLGPSQWMNALSVFSPRADGQKETNEWTDEKAKQEW